MKRVRLRARRHVLLTLRFKATSARQKRASTEKLSNSSRRTIRSRQSADASATSVARLHVQEERLTRRLQSTISRSLSQSKICMRKQDSCPKLSSRPTSKRIGDKRLQSSAQALRDFLAHTILQPRAIFPPCLKRTRNSAVCSPTAFLPTNSKRTSSTLKSTFCVNSALSSRPV